MMKTFMLGSRLWRRILMTGLVSLVLLGSGAVSPAASLKGQKIAVVVYPRNEAAKSYQKNALSRLEDILADNGVVVLDREKVDKLKDVFTTLDDPGAFVTAEMFVENAGKYEIQALAAIYLNIELTSGMADYYTASAHADIRFVSEQDAKVLSLTTTPMGTPGRPPSDGLTQNSAAINAVQRTIDDACAKLGLNISDPATPRSVQLSLEEITLPNWKKLVSDKRSTENDKDIVALIAQKDQKWRDESATATARAPAGSLAAVADYVVDTDFHRRPPRLFGSHVHAVDTKTKQLVVTFECHAVEKMTRQELGTKKVLDCMFLLNWRYLTAVTGNRLFLWDTERGQPISSIPLKSPPDAATLRFFRDDQASYLVVDTGKKNAPVFKIVRKQ